MKTLKIRFSAFLIFVLCASCNFATSESNQYLADGTPLQNHLKYNNIYDDINGLIMCQIPLPETWKYNSKKNAKITVTAPNNIIVNKTEIQNYAYAK